MINENNEYFQVESQIDANFKLMRLTSDKAKGHDEGETHFDQVYSQRIVQLQSTTS